MEYESLPTISVPKIGFGTARIGGRIIPNPLRDRDWIRILREALELGYKHFDTAELYALGYSEALIGRALRESGTGREHILITTKVWPIHLSHDGVLNSCNHSLRRLQTEFIDIYLIHLPNPLIPLEETFRGLNKLVQQGKVRHLGVSNFELDMLRKAQALSETPLVTNQIPYSIHERRYVQNGVVAYCQENNILVTAYTPLRHPEVKANSVIQEIAQSRGITSHQVALAWLTSQDRVVTIPMSFKPQHQKDNIEAGNIKLTRDELKLIDDLAGRP